MTSPTWPPTSWSWPGRGPLRGRLRVPGDKGMSHRALLFAAMADGRSRVRGLAGGEDVGPHARRARPARRVASMPTTPGAGAVIVDGRGLDAFAEPGDVLDCGNSGTSMRLLDRAARGPSRSSRCSPATTRCVERPMARVLEPLRAMGAHLDGRAGGTRPPLVVRGGDLVGCDAPTSRWPARR